MPTTLIFGASRGLGRAFTDHALRQGHRVLALVRQPEMAAELRTLGVEVIEGDALDPAAVQQAEKLRVSADQAQRFASAAALRKQNVEPLPEPPRPTAPAGSGEFTPDNQSFN